MKRFTLCLFTGILAVLTAAGQSSDMPYTANYSSNFSIGKSANAKMILQLYKDFEKADWSKDSWFDDTLFVILPDGTTLQGKDAALAEFRKEREGLSSAEFTFDAIIPLESVDRNENWVALWGSLKGSAKDSGESAMLLNDFQSIWRISKDGKVNFIRFFNARPMMQ
jgi:hypothetical protein